MEEKLREKINRLVEKAERKLRAAQLLRGDRGRSFHLPHFPLDPRQFRSLPLLTRVRIGKQGDEPDPSPVPPSVLERGHKHRALSSYT